MQEPKNTFCSQEALCNEIRHFKIILIVAVLWEENNQPNKQNTHSFSSPESNKEWHKKTVQTWLVPSAPAASSLCMSLHLTNRTTNNNSVVQWLITAFQERMYVCKGLGLGVFSKYEVFSFSLLALLSSHWSTVLCTLSLCYRAGSSSTTLSPYPSHLGKVADYTSRYTLWKGRGFPTVWEWYVHIFQQLTD